MFSSKVPGFGCPALPKASMFSSCIAALFLNLAGCGELIPFSSSNAASNMTSASSIGSTTDLFSAVIPALLNPDSSPALADETSLANGQSQAAANAPALDTAAVSNIAAKNLKPSDLETNPVISGGADNKPKNPILFVTQVPTPTQFATRISTFANHLPGIDRSSRGGDLMIRYPNGTLRNLTKEAGFGTEGFQGSNAIAVREPSVHWNGDKALFSMVIGAPTKQFEVRSDVWQIYEVSGLQQGSKLSIVKVPYQPSGYNNVSPIYGSDDKIIFTSDRPRNGAAHLYPQLDEYESTPTITGIWVLDLQAKSYRILNHAVSGAFTPLVDSFGRIVYTRWDHLQRDQQADLDRTSVQKTYGAFNVTDESPSAAMVGLSAEVFPEPRQTSMSAFGRVSGFETNLFTPWQMNEDGTEEETLNHFGRHEFQFNALLPSFLDDAALKSPVKGVFSANKLAVLGGGLFQFRENPQVPGQFIGVLSKEFATLSSGVIIRMNGAPNLNPEQMTVDRLTNADAANDPIGGRYRSPNYLSDGKIVATFSPSSITTNPMQAQLRLVTLATSQSSGLLFNDQFLTGDGIRKSVTWWNPDQQLSFDGLLWELEAVEVVAKVRPTKAATPLEAPERSIFAQEGVDEASFKTWMANNKLSLIVTRDQTSRDQADKLQPFNLRVPGGVQTIANSAQKAYDVSHFQLFQADQVRGYSYKGRRPIATPSTEVIAMNASNPTGPTASVPIAKDGSSAALVPANRAMTWQTTDPSGNAVVRERVWITFQPGEIRVCASCHGVNSKDQAGKPPPSNPPEALRTLLQAWKTATKR
jgi:Hydrazine synthase alpha subunit middle domain